MRQKHFVPLLSADTFTKGPPRASKREAPGSSAKKCRTQQQATKRSREGPSPECSKQKPPAPNDEPPLKKPDRTHRQSRFDPPWAKDFPWLQTTYSGGMDQYPCRRGEGGGGRWCQWHDVPPLSKTPLTSSEISAWEGDFGRCPLVTLNCDAVLRQSRSQSHQDAVTAKTNLGMGFMESTYKEAISV